MSKRRRKAAAHRTAEFAPADDEQESLRPSKSAMKRELAAIQVLAERLMALNESQLTGLPLNTDTLEILAQGAGLKGGAAQRHIRHAGKLLARDDWQAAASALDALERPERQQIRAFHELERWRDQLIQDGVDGIAALTDAGFELEPGELVALLNEIERRGEDKGPRRALFRYLARHAPMPQPD